MGESLIYFGWSSYKGWFTQEGYGPVTVITWWERVYRQPIFLVTNIKPAGEACYWYKKRFQIETFFSDEKSRGFYMHKSHLPDPERLSTLMVAACLVYLWIVYLGWSLYEKIG